MYESTQVNEHKWAYTYKLDSTSLYESFIALTNLRLLSFYHIDYAIIIINELSAEQQQIR